MTGRLQILALSLALPVLLSACRRETIRVYTVAKEQPPDEHAGHDHAPGEGHEDESAHRQQPLPQIAQVPADWKPMEPGKVSVVQYAIKAEGGEATVNITPLPNLAGREALVVNMWREQVGQQALTQEELAEVFSEVEVAGSKGQLFEIAGAAAGMPMRIVTALVHRPGASWFFKLSGDESLVAAQKDAFLEFCKGVRLPDAGASAPTAAAAPASASAAAPASKWNPPPGWTALTAGQMQVAKFAVPEVNGAKAEATISIFPSDTGGTLANVNRWRKQIGAAEVDEAGLAALVSPLDPAVPEATLADLTHEGKQVLGAIVPRGGQWYFYKLLGDTAAVSAAREAFIALAKAQP